MNKPQKGKILKRRLQKIWFESEKGVTPAPPPTRVSLKRDVSAVVHNAPTRPLGRDHDMIFVQL